MLVRTILSPLLRSLSQPVEGPPQNVLCYMTIRWRKRRWVPKAPSKIYVVPVKSELPEEDYHEHQTRVRHYRTALRTVRHHFFTEYKESRQIQAAASTGAVKLAKWQEILAINDEWNARTAVVRNERLAAEAKQREQKLMEVLMQQEAEREEQQRTAELLVAQTKKEAKNFITEENLDAVIEEMLNNPVDYNFAIDTDGNRYFGVELADMDSSKEKAKPSTESSKDTTDVQGAAV